MPQILDILALTLNTVYCLQWSAFWTKQSKASCEKCDRWKTSLLNTARDGWNYRVSKSKRVFFFEAARNIMSNPLKQWQTFFLTKIVAIVRTLVCIVFFSLRSSVGWTRTEYLSLPLFWRRVSWFRRLIDYAALAWFGMPWRKVFILNKSFQATCGGMGTGILRYENFDVDDSNRQIGDSFQQSEIHLWMER